MLPGMPVALSSLPWWGGYAVGSPLRNSHVAIIAHVKRDACGASFSAVVERLRSGFPPEK